MFSPTSFRFLSLISLLLIIINPSQSHSSEFNRRNGVVFVSLYYESLCPYSKDFILNALENFVKLDVMSIVHLHLVPYGNAITSANGTVSCQHGSDECYYNTIEACALKTYPLRFSLAFIFCIENGLPATRKKPSLWRSCSKRLRLNPKPIKNCYSRYGNQLHRHNGRETYWLNPPLTHTPWLLVNGQYVNADFGDLVKSVCNAYKGPLRFRACKRKW